MKEMKVLENAEWGTGVPSVGQPAWRNKAFPMLMDASLRWPSGKYEMALCPKRERESSSPETQASVLP